MKSKALFVLSAIAILGLASCGDTPSASSSDTEEVTSSTPVIEDTSSTTTEPPAPVARYKIIDSLDDHVSLVGLPEEAEEGETITFSIAVAPGYEFLDEVLVKAGDDTIDLTKDDLGKYTFTMPAKDVTILASDQISSFGISYEIAENLDLKAFYRTKNSDLVKEEFEKVAGVYEGVYYGGDQPDEGYRIKLDAMGVVEVAQHYTEPWKDYAFGDARYGGKGYYEATVDEADPNVIHISFTLTEFFGSSGYMTSMEGDMTITLTPNEDPALAPVAVLSGTLIERSSSYPYTTQYDSVVPGHEITRKEVLETDTSGYTYFGLDSLPTSRDYLDTVYYQAIINDEWDVDSITSGGAPLTLNSDGYYEHHVPYHKTTVTVTQKTRLAPISIESDHEALTAKAYVREEQVDETGAPIVGEDGKPVVVYKEVTEVPYKQTVYLKITAPEDGSVGLSYITVQYGSGTSSKTDSGVNPSAFVENEDGYLTSTRYLRMDDMGYGLSIHLTSVSSWIEAGDSKIMSGKSTKLNEAGTEGLLTANDKGQVTYMEASKTTNYYYTADDVQGEVLSLHKLSDSDKTKAYPAYTHNGLYLLNTTGGKAIEDFVIAGGDIGGEGHEVNYAYAGTKFAVLTAMKDGQPVNAAIGDFDPAEGKDSETGVDHDALTVKWDVTFHNYTTESATDSIWATEGVFDVKDGDTVLGTYSRTGRILTSFVKGVAGTFTGEGGTLITDGVGKVTFNGVAPFLVKNGQDAQGNPIVSFLIKDDAATTVTLYALTLNDEAKTFTHDAGKPFGTVLKKNYNGAKIDVNSDGKTLKASSFYQTGIGAISPTGEFEPTKGYWEKQAFDYELNADGSIVMNNKKFIYSPDGTVVFVRDVTGTSPVSYLLTSAITSYSSSANKIGSVTLGDGVYLAEIVAATPSHGTASDVQLLIRDTGGKKLELVAWSDVTLQEGTAANWWEDGAKITYLKEDGTTSASMEVLAGELIQPVDGTYVVDGKQYVIADGKITVDGVVYDATRSGNKFTYVMVSTSEVGEILETPYTLTVVDVEAKTATLEVGEGRVVGESHASHDVYAQGVGSYGYAKNASGAYVSQNKGKGSSVAAMKIVVKQAGTLTFDWVVSSERRYDYFYIEKDGATLPGYGEAEKGEHSGELSGTFSLEVVEGEEITICYKKDTSGDNGGDTLTVSNIAIA